MYILVENDCVPISIELTHLILHINHVVAMKWIFVVRCLAVLCIEVTARYPFVSLRVALNFFSSNDHWCGNESSSEWVSV